LIKNNIKVTKVKSLDIPTSIIYTSFVMHASNSIVLSILAAYKKHPITVLKKLFFRWYLLVYAHKQTSAATNRDGKYSLKFLIA